MDDETRNDALVRCTSWLAPLMRVVGLHGGPVVALAVEIAAGGLGDMPAAFLLAPSTARILVGLATKLSGAGRTGAFGGR